MKTLVKSLHRVTSVYNLTYNEKEYLGDVMPTGQTSITQIITTYAGTTRSADLQS